MKKDNLDLAFEHVKRHKLFYGVIFGIIFLVMVIGITYEVASPPPEPIIGNSIRSGMDLSWDQIGKLIVIVSFPFILLAWLIHGVGFYIIR